MTKSATSETSSDPAPHKQNFYLGVLAGAAIGAGIAYLSSNKKGDSLKKEILAKAKKISKQIPNLLDELNNEENDQEKQPTKIQKKLNTNKKNKKKITTDQNDTSEPNLTTATKIAKTVKNTGKKAKRFFTKAGRILKT